MTALHTSGDSALCTLNDLRRGSTYRATTDAGVTVGEYLGIETAHGDRAILLRGRMGTKSILLAAITSLRVAA